MFKVLTGEKKRRALSPATITASIAAHLLLLGGLVYASTGESGTIEVIGSETEIEPLRTEPQEPPPPPPVVEQPTTPPAADEPPAPVEALEIPEVTEVPKVIPVEAPFTPPVDPTDYTRDGRRGPAITPPTSEPRGTGDGPVVAPRAPDWVADDEDVEERPVLDRNGLSRALERHYPSTLRDSRVSGRVVIELIVDEEGRPRPGSVRVIEASHPAFEQATLRAVERFRFTPARMMGIPVPVRVTIPIQWTTGN